MSDHEVKLPPILLSGYESRREARAMIWLTALAIGLLWSLLFIAAPGGPTPMFDGPIPDLRALLLVPIGMQLIGLGWMIRIYRSAVDAEPDHDQWRYRAD